MEKEKDVFRFEDFVDVDKLQKMKSELLKEGVFTEEEDFDDEEVDYSLNPYGNSGGVDMEAVARVVRSSYGDSAMNNLVDFEASSQYSGTTDTYEYTEEFLKYMDSLSGGEISSGYGQDEVEDHENEDDEEVALYDESIGEKSEQYYSLYRDKSEDFRCDIAVEGVSTSDTEVRLIVESDEWTLMFVGEIRKGQCVIPMKKLSILNEGAKGRIRLEVNADGTLFTPWEDNFVVKASKKVTVKVNEGKSYGTKKPVTKKAPGVSVKVRKS